jgi:hypothetical protein
MKNYFTLILILIISTSISAQDLPNIPIKNGMVFYSFDHKLDNTAKCLSSYIDGPMQRVGLITSIQNKLLLVGEKIFKEDKNIYSYSLTLTRKLLDLNCQDTFNCQSNALNIMFQPNFKTPQGIVDLITGKSVVKNLTASITIVFISKNEYILKIKDIVYSISWTKGSKSGVDIFNLGEYYEKVKSSGELKNDDIKFFSFIDEIMKTTDKVILSAITDTYKADEL